MYNFFVLLEDLLSFRIVHNINRLILDKRKDSLNLRSFTNQFKSKLSHREYGLLISTIETLEEEFSTFRESCDKYYSHLSRELKQKDTRYNY